MASAPSPKKLKENDSTADPQLETENCGTETQKSMKDLDSCQNEIEALNEQASLDIQKVEQKFNQLRKPHFDKRATIIDKVPNFWQTAFNNHYDLSSLLEDRERDCFSYLTKLDVEEFEDITAGYKINFHFKENPYFDNSVLTKEFQWCSLGVPTSLSTPIQWKEGMNLTQTNEPTRTRGGRKRQLERRSFFGWYNDHIDPMSDTIAEIIKDEFWHNPLQYFLIAKEIDNEEEREDDDNEDGDDASNGGEDDGIQTRTFGILCSKQEAPNANPENEESAE